MSYENYKDPLGPETVARLLQAEALLKQCGFESIHLAFWPHANCGLDEISNAVAEIIEAAFESPSHP